jgi:hypothetical protein
MCLSFLIITLIRSATELFERHFGSLNFMLFVVPLRDQRLQRLKKQLINGYERHLEGFGTGGASSPKLIRCADTSREWAGNYYARRQGYRQAAG